MLWITIEVTDFSFYLIFKFNVNIANLMYYGKTPVMTKSFLLHQVFSKFLKIAEGHTTSQSPVMLGHREMDRKKPSTGYSLTGLENPECRCAQERAPVVFIFWISNIIGVASVVSIWIIVSFQRCPYLFSDSTIPWTHVIWIKLLVKQWKTVISFGDLPV